MSRLTIEFPEDLDDVLAERVKESGATSVEEYVLSLVRADSMSAQLDAILLERSRGPFTELGENWMEEVREAAAKLRE